MGTLDPASPPAYDTTLDIGFHRTAGYRRGYGRFGHDRCIYIKIWLIEIFTHDL